MRPTVYRSLTHQTSTSLSLSLSLFPPLLIMDAASVSHFPLAISVLRRSAFLHTFIPGEMDVFLNLSS